MNAAVRVLEVTVGLVLGCLGLFVSLASLIAGVAACQRMFDGQSAGELGPVVLGAALGSAVIDTARRYLEII